MRFRFERKKHIPIILAAIILVVSLGAYITNDKKKGNNENKPLTMEQKIEDFEYLYSFISKNYPYLKINERLNGVNWLAEEDNFRNAIKNTDGDYGFMSEMSKILNRLNDLHTHILNDDSYLGFYNLYSELPEEAGFKPVIEVFEDEIVVNRYKSEEQNMEVFEHHLSYLRNNPACKTDILITDEVAYLRIYQMENERIEYDGVIIRNFFEEIKDYKKLIIDIRGNGGGNDLYWMKNVIEPLTNEVITVENFVFARDDYSKYYYESMGYNFSPVSELGESTLSGFPEEIGIDFKYYDVLTRTFNPVDPVGFTGKIYLLVDKDVYSSADSFATICKDSGFAKLVGATTSGGGNGSGPLFSSLPNSGILIRFSGALILNNDRSIHEEIYTIPDIEVDATIGTSYSSDNAIQYIINE